VHLEECGLRLHRDGERRDGVDDRTTEAVEIPYAVREWVEADDELALLALDRLGKSVREEVRARDCQVTA
jgi:hypothetical protein